MEEIPDDFEKEIVPEQPPCEPPPLAREKTGGDRAQAQARADKGHGAGSADAHKQSIIAGTGVGGRGGLAPARRGAPS